MVAWLAMTPLSNDPLVISSLYIGKITGKSSPKDQYPATMVSVWIASSSPSLTSAVTGLLTTLFFLADQHVCGIFSLNPLREAAAASPRAQPVWPWVLWGWPGLLSRQPPLRHLYRWDLSWECF